MKKISQLQKIKGCLIGGACGDALGFPVEFETVQSIYETYGPRGIHKYILSHKKALISDDTQMSLFTANALVNWKQSHEKNPLEFISLAYKEWWKTQNNVVYTGENTCWIMDYEELYDRRAPGATCLSALSETFGSIEKKNNDSKGCGGLMRVAPIGLCSQLGEVFSINDICMLGAESAAITHGHPLGYIPAATLTYIIWQCVFTKHTLEKIIKESIAFTESLFPNEPCLVELTALLQKAINLAKTKKTDLEAIKEIGEGWVAEETLAIAIYCAVKYQNNFAKGIVAAVNHSGDSDSTGSVTGNILGAYLGLQKIPWKFKRSLELKSVINRLAVEI